MKVVMEKGDNICMSGPGYHECNIKYTQRLTYSGEYLHAAPVEHRQHQAWGRHLERLHEPAAGRRQAAVLVGAGR